MTKSMDVYNTEIIDDKDFCSEELSLDLWLLGCPYDDYYDGPFYSLYTAQKWLRKAKKLHITLFSQSQESWMYRITKVGQKLEDGIYEEDFDLYESALHHGLERMVKMVKEELNN